MNVEMFVFQRVDSLSIVFVLFFFSDGVFKIVLIGDSCVGKTGLLERFYVSLASMVKLQSQMLDIVG